MDLSFVNECRDFNPDDGIAVLRSGGFITMSWGVTKIEEVMNCGGVTKGIKFHVNGMKFQGEVLLTVNFMDYYQIRFIKDGKVVHMIDDVCVMDHGVIHAIDEYVEKQEEYIR